jgi:hypothetical protein
MISNIILVLSFATAVIGMVCYKRLTMPFKLLSAYLVYSFLDNVVNQYINAVYKNNVPVLHIETIANYLFFSFIYYYLLKNKLVKKAILVSIVLVTLFFFINALLLQPYYRVFPSNAMLINEIVFVIFSLLLFKQMLLYPLQVNIIKQGVFWFNTAVLFFSTTMFVNFALINYYFQHNIQVPVLTYFWHSIDITFNILLGIAILTDKKQVGTAGTE